MVGDSPMYFNPFSYPRSVLSLTFRSLVTKPSFTCNETFVRSSWRIVSFHEFGSKDRWTMNWYSRSKTEIFYELDKKALIPWIERIVPKFHACVFRASSIATENPSRHHQISRVSRIINVDLIYVCVAIHAELIAFDNYDNDNINNNNNIRSLRDHHRGFLADFRDLSVHEDDFDID